jgi:hypothetical protein
LGTVGFKYITSQVMVSQSGKRDRTSFSLTLFSV